MPVLSIIIPVYNQERYLDQCLASVATQIFSDFEVLLIDDGSTDTSGAICDCWAEKDRRIQVIHKQNAGVNQAVLDGCRAASGSFIGFVDSDDWILPDMYQELITSAKEYGADVVQCGARINGTTRSEEFYAAREYVFTNGEIESQLLTPYFEAYSDLYPVLACRWNKVYTAALIQKTIPYMEHSLSMGEDLIMNLWALSLCKKVIVRKESEYYCYRIHEASASRKYSVAKQTGMFMLFDYLREIARQQNREGKALDSFESRNIAGMMLDVCLSILPIQEKQSTLRALYASLRDKNCLTAIGKKHPFYIRAAIAFLRMGWFWPVVTVLHYVKVTRG